MTLAALRARAAVAHLDADGSSTLEAFRARVREAPGHPAIECTGQTLRYGELAAHAEALAQRLVCAGASASPVAIETCHAGAFATALIGCAIADAIAVPIDPTQPRPRRDAIVREAAARIRLHAGDDGRLQEARADGACAGPSDADGAAPAAPPAAARGERAATLYYTSGSTGAPRGVVQTHSAWLHHARTYAQLLALGRDDRMALVFSPAFSAAALDFHAALVSGATLVAWPPAGVPPARLLEELREARIGRLHCVPSLYRELLRAADADRAASPALPALRSVDVAGEAMHPDEVARHRRVFGRATFVHRLALSECSTATALVIEHDTPLPTGATLPVGTPLPGTRVRVVDTGGDARPGGGDADDGEIVVEGPGVCAGYWRRPDLDAQAFEGLPPARAFRTGDRGRLGPHGLVHLGRLDARVKHGGHAVDLVEVEAAVAALPGVREAAVRIQRGLQRSTVLVAHYIPDPHGEGPPADPTGGPDALALGRLLRKQLLEVLPIYMVPSLFVPTADLPRTVSGKCDRRALPEVDLRALRAARPADDVADPLLRRTLAAFEQAIGLVPLGPDADFFALGGDSLAAARMLAQLEDATGLALPSSALLDAPTPALLAARLRTSARERSGLCITLARGGTGAPLLCVPGVRGDGMIFHALSRSVDRPVHAFEATDFRGTSLAAPRIEDLAARCLAELSDDALGQAPCVLGFSNGVLLAYELALRLRKQGRQPRLVLLDGFAPGAPATPTQAGWFARRVDGWLGDRVPIFQRDSPRRTLRGYWHGRTRHWRARAAVALGRPIGARRRVQLRRRQQIEMRRDYRPPPTQTPLLLVRASEAHYPPALCGDEALGWRALARGPLRIETLETTHGGLLKPPAVGALARLVEAWCEAPTVCAQPPAGSTQIGDDQARGS